MYTEPSSFDVDNHPRIIIWDEKERLYRMVKLHDDTTSLTTKHNFIFLNRFYEITEGEVNPFAPGAGNANGITPQLAVPPRISGP